MLVAIVSRFSIELSDLAGYGYFTGETLHLECLFFVCMQQSVGAIFSKISRFENEFSNQKI